MENFKRYFLLFFVGCLAACSKPAPEAAHVSAASQIEAGRYLVVAAGCNDCHTPGYPESNGATPEEEWLTGVPVGYSGPWGTSYAANLRLALQDMDEAQWLARVRGGGLPPMPWSNLAAMHDDDLKAIYAYVKSLPAKGEKTPDALPPGVHPQTPYFWFVPVTGPLPPPPPSPVE